MTPEQILGLAIALVLMGLGAIGSVAPGLPGSPVILAAAILHKLYFQDSGAAWWVLLLMTALAALAAIIDYLATLFGARALGATWKGLIGAVLGGLVGLFGGPFGLIVGPFLGAVLLEMAGGRNVRESSRAGLGVLVGFLAGAAGKLACSVAMIGLFALDVIRRSTGVGG